MTGNVVDNNLFFAPDGGGEWEWKGAWPGSAPATSTARRACRARASTSEPTKRGERDEDAGDREGDLETGRHVLGRADELPLIPVCLLTRGKSEP